MNTMNHNSIMDELDKWVLGKGNGEYIPEEDSRGTKNFGLLPDYGIQQVRKEILEFSKFLLKCEKRENILEVGLGYFGSTHFLWRLIFDRVATIESNHARFLTFGKNMREYYKKWILDDGRSSFFGGFSSEPSIIEKVYRSFQSGIDTLFIDADHSYRGILSDWLIYAPLVKSGGIVAFHDLELDYDYDGGPKGFFKDLESGKIISGKKYKLNRIQYSKYHGIGYYIKE